MSPGFVSTVTYYRYVRYWVCSLFLLFGFVLLSYIVLFLWDFHFNLPGSWRDGTAALCDHFIYLFIYQSEECACVHGCAMDAQLEDSLQKLVLSFCCVGAAYRTLVTIMFHDQGLLPTEPSLQPLVYLCLIVKKLLISGIHPRRDRRERGGDGERKDGKEGLAASWSAWIVLHPYWYCVCALASPHPHTSYYPFY